MDITTLTTCDGVINPSTGRCVKCFQPAQTTSSYCGRLTVARLIAPEQKKSKDELIAEIRAGRLAIENDGTLQELQKAVHDICWPLGAYPAAGRRYYFKHEYTDETWTSHNSWSGESIKATDLIQRIEEKDNFEETLGKSLKVHGLTDELPDHLKTPDFLFKKEEGPKSTILGQGYHIKKEFPKEKEPILDAIHSDTEESSSTIYSHPIYGTSVGIGSNNRDEPVSSDTQSKLWRELIDIYDVTDRSSEGYGSLIKVLSKQFTIQRNPSLGPNQ